MESLAYFYTLILLLAVINLLMGASYALYFWKIIGKQGKLIARCVSVGLSIAIFLAGYITAFFFGMHTAHELAFLFAPAAFCVAGTVLVVRR